MPATESDSVVQPTTPTAARAQKNLLILLHTPHLARVPLLLLKYGCDEVQLDFLVLGEDERKNCEELCQLSKCRCFVNVAYEPGTAEEGGDNFDPGLIMHRNIARHMDAFAGGLDLLYAHADMWMNVPQILARARFGEGDSTIALSPVNSNPPEGEDGTCAKSICLPVGDVEADGTWHWWTASKERCLAANEQWRAVKEQWMANLGGCCHGWADLAFVPASQHAAFVSLVGSSASSKGVLWNVHVESSLHTALNYINQSLSSRTGRLAWGTIECAGMTNTQVSWPAAASVDCAHKVDLADPQLATYAEQGACHSLAGLRQALDQEFRVRHGNSSRPFTKHDRVDVPVA